MPGKLSFTMLNFLNLNAVYKQCVLVMMYKVTLPSEEKPNGDLYHQGSRRMVTSTSGEQAYGDLYNQGVS